VCNSFCPPVRVNAHDQRVRASEPRLVGQQRGTGYICPHLAQRAPFEAQVDLLAWCKRQTWTASLGLRVLVQMHLELRDAQGKGAAGQAIVEHSNRGARPHMKTQLTETTRLFGQERWQNSLAQHIGLKQTSCLCLPPTCCLISAASSFRLR